MALINWTDPNPPATKSCWKCGEVKPRNDKHFSKNSRTSDGLSFMCTDCLRKETSMSVAVEVMR